MQIAVFHPGTQHSWQTALALQQLDRLAWYATSIFYDPSRFPYFLERFAPRAIAQRMHAEFRRFGHPQLDPARVRTAGLAEWFERIAARCGFNVMAKRIDRFGNDRFVRTLAHAIRSDDPFALWGYSSSSLSTFELAARTGRRCILDRTVGDFRAFNHLLDDLMVRYGEWFLPGGLSVPADQIAKDQQEYDLADAILTGSRFAADTVCEYGGPAAAAKVRVLPYCFDEALFSAMPVPQPVSGQGPVRFLFIGQINPRKGIQHLLEAFIRLPSAKATLTLVGQMGIPDPVFARYADRVTFHPTVARADIPAIMASHHVLVFPSYFEGSALSLIEGLASGLALIHTPSSGNGVTPETGILIDRPCTDLLHEAMLTAISNRDQLNHWRTNAQLEASRYSFANYRQNIAGLLNDLEI